jgi:hypothetical protein
MSRTAVFLRGINKAIKQKLSENSTRPIKILYAGTGPYATLIVPLLTLYSSYDLEVDLLDINEISLEALSKIITELGLQEYINKTYLSDATTFKVEKDYDIMISETMQAALKKEPQIAIMQNLIPQMSENAIFIPERITISAAIFYTRHWNIENKIFSEKEFFTQKELFFADKQHLDATKYSNTLELVEPLEKSCNLYLQTTICVFEDEFLKDGDCSLTLPFRISNLEKDQTGTFHFWYVQGKIPHICCKISGDEHIYEAIGSKMDQISI